MRQDSCSKFGQRLLYSRRSPTVCEAASIRGTYLTLFEDRMRRRLHVWLDRSHVLYNPKQRLFAPLLLRHAAADAAVAAAAVAAAVATLPTS